VITTTDYWMDRDKDFPNELTDVIRENASHTVSRVNLLLTVYKKDTGDSEPKLISSGWRPPQVNSKTPNAAVRSKHMTGEAIDIADPEGELDQWCMDNLDELERIGLYLEHPSATKNWCHLQIVAPKSGRRVFYP
jgi:hypothetical protein